MVENNNQNGIFNRLRKAVRALRHRNFRLFFTGQSISLLGTWMQQVAMGWLVYRLSHSEFILGLVAFASQAPTFFITSFAGVLADRWDRRRILIVTQVLSMCQAFVLAFLVFTNTITVSWVIVLSIMVGVLNAFDIPSRQSLLIEMIDKREDLGNAIALNSSMYNAARLIGPSIAGILIAIGGEVLCFVINGLSFLGVIVALFAMNIRHMENKEDKKDLVQGLREGFVYVFASLPIRTILGLLAFVSLMGTPYIVLMPAFTKEVLHGGPQSFGFLMAATGFGALGGALYLATRETVRGLLRKIAFSSFCFGCGLILFSLSRTLEISMFVLILASFGMMTQVIASNTIIQTIVDDDKRGRVMSLFAMSFMGMAPFGCLMMGALANKIGTPLTMLLGGMSCIFASVIFMRQLPRLRGIVRDIYLRKGVITPTHQ